MPEPSLRKLLIFTDNRQDAAFQAGWMEERSKRFRMRHLLYQLLAEQPGKTWSYWGLVDDLLAEAQASQILSSGGWDDSDQSTRVRWFLIEEFASLRQRRSSLEQLGLAAIRYKDLEVVTDKEFFERWAETFHCQPDEVVNLTRLLLDHHRRRGRYSDPHLAHYWSNLDKEVRRGLITTAQYYRPEALVFQGGTDSSHKKGWLANNGRSSAQVLVKNAVTRGVDLTDTFLSELWQWLINHEYLVPVELTRKRYGRTEIITEMGDIYQVNAERVGITEVDYRYVCNFCGRAFPVATPSNVCPGYRCGGTLNLAERDSEHYDVVQYTQLSFVPMRAREHSGQVPRQDREYVEQEFKKDNGTYNTIVATPTLELGVDIGKLEMVMMRNVPPTPANYAQRAGRAGRRHRIAVVFTHARGAAHDRYFFANPPEMIAGNIRVPAFSMRNEPLIRKHVHSAVLTALRELASSDESTILDQAFPFYIRDYFGELRTDAGGQERFRYLDSPPTFPALRQLIRKYYSNISNRLTYIFTDTWPSSDREAVSTGQLTHYLDNMPTRLEQVVRSLFLEIQSYRDALTHFDQIERGGYALSHEEEAQRRRFRYALRTYQQETLDNWTLSYLSNVGFLPGYALSRENVIAQSLDPFLQISRPATIALRELTPGSNVYANRNVFQVQTLNFYKLRVEDKEWTTEEIRRQLRLNPISHRVYDPVQQQFEGGGAQGIPFESYQLVDVEMVLQQSIDDRQEYRHRTAFDIAGMLLNKHEGGFSGNVGDREFIYLYQEQIRLVNLGPLRPGTASPGIGFPICPQCGETRSPYASEAEIDSFREGHRKQCGVPDVMWTAIHVELTSDVLRIGPYETTDKAINILEGIIIGAQMVLDMEEGELEGFVLVDEDDRVWTVIYDPLPGGSGFLPEIVHYWPAVCRHAIEVLNTCTCEIACYKCMKHFRNQHYHRYLDRFEAIELLDKIDTQLDRQHDIPTIIIHEPISGEGPEVDRLDSPAEEEFISILQDIQFPIPDKAQYKVNLSGEYTVADFAYEDQKILIFIDGLSESLHGNPIQAQQDRIKRAKARMQGYKVVEIPAQALSDDTMLSAFLDELAVYLEQD